MDHFITQEVAGKVAAAILESGISKRSVSEAAGIPATTFGRKIKGHVEFTFSELIRIAEVIGVKPSEFTPTAFDARIGVAA